MKSYWIDEREVYALGVHDKAYILAHRPPGCPVFKSVLASSLSQCLLHKTELKHAYSSFLFLLTYVEVGCRPHLPVLGNYINNQRVAHQSDQHDKGEEEGDQPGVCEEGVLISLLLLIIPTSSQREVRLRAVDPNLPGGVP